MLCDCRNEKGEWESFDGIGDPRSFMEGKLQKLYNDEGICCRPGSGVFGLNPAEADPTSDEGKAAKEEVARNFKKHFKRFTK